MNLVAKEFVAAQNQADPGVLILSRFAGAAEEMPEALIVNPFDIEEIADRMHEGLIMPLEERQSRHKSLLTSIRATSARTFCQTFLTALRNEGQVSSDQPDMDDWPAPSDGSSPVRELAAHV
jgi:trehalose 6-phosphate synthase